MRKDFYLLLSLSYPFCALIYSVKLREIAGPGYTNAPNQNAMFLFVFGAFLWILLSVSAFIGQNAFLKIKSNFHFGFGMLCCVGSWSVPYFVGMK